MYLRQGDHVRLLRDWQHVATTETAGIVVDASREFCPAEIRVDGVGVGGGVVDMLAEQGLPVWDLQAGAGAVDSLHFVNARAEWYFQLRDRFEAGAIDIDPYDDELTSQLASLRYMFDSRGRIKIESKDDMRKRGMPSPDRADALMLAFAELAGGDVIIDMDDVFPDLRDFEISRY